MAVFRHGGEQTVPNRLYPDDVLVEGASTGQVLTCRLDAGGRVLEADPHDDALLAIADLIPALDAPRFAALRAAVDAAPAGGLWLDTPTACGVVMTLRLSTAGGADGSYLAELREAENSSSYRLRLEQRLAFERMIAALSTELIHAPAERLDMLIEQALGRIGRLFAVDRAYLFRFSADRFTQSNTHEWVEEGVSREAEHLQDVPMDHFPWLMREMLAGNAVHVPVVADLPDKAATERAEFIREGIQSVALVPFGGADRPEGFIGFDAVHRQRHWPSDILLGLRLVGQMFSNAFRAQEMAEQLVRLAFHNPLTGLGNRRFLGERLCQALERSQRNGTQLAVIVIDLDDFKLVNDSHGHSLGDEVLKLAASRIVGSVRATDIVARLGGDEFVAVVEMDGLASLSQLIGRLFDEMLEPVELRGGGFALRMSVGIALYPDDGIDAEALLRQADTAMYAAKAEGKNRFAFFTPRMTRDSRAALQMRHDLGLALERNEILPHYQPRVALPSMRVIGFEALARWHHPQRGLLMPGDFLDLAERSGVIGKIDLCVLSHALSELGRWRRRQPDCHISVNLDAGDLQDEDLIIRLQTLLATAGDSANGVEIEITESSLMRDVDQASRTLTRLREGVPGLQVAIDDFGSGYSSLACLGRLPVTTLKIDRGFTAELATGNRRSARAIIHSILDLGRSLGLHVVAEGVETAAQADELCELGCVEAQGYLFSQAVPAEEATRLLAQGICGKEPARCPVR